MVFPYFLDGLGKVMVVGDGGATLVWPQNLIKLLVHVFELPIHVRIDHLVKKGFGGRFVGQVRDQ